MPTCVACDRKEGAMYDDDVNPETPIGEMVTCSTCGAVSVCPDCYHESYCCSWAETELESLIEDADDADSLVAKCGEYLLKG